MSGEDDGTIPFKRLGAKMTAIERESAIIEHMKLEAQLGALRIENAELKRRNELLLSTLWDTTMALIRAHRGKRTLPHQAFT